MNKKKYTDEELIVRKRQQYSESNQRRKNQEKLRSKNNYKKNKKQILLRFKKFRDDNNEKYKAAVSKGVKKYKASHREEINTRNRIYKKIIINNLNDAYVKQLISSSGLTDAPQQLIELKRNTLQLKRILKNKNDAKSNSNLRTTE